MTRPYAPGFHIPTDLLLKASASGVFPMAESAADPEVFWVRPETRGIIPLNTFHVPRSLRRTSRRGLFEIRFDSAFEATIEACAESREERRSTWINGPIREAYVQLHRMGHCHSVEAWRDGRLVGGLYGVTLGRAYFGESMFHTVRDASKIALVHLIARLKAGGFTLCDTQYVTDHLRSFGAVEVPKKRYHKMLDEALTGLADFTALPADRPISGAEALAILEK